MVLSSTSNKLLSDIKRRGYTITLKESRLHVSPQPPQEIVEEIRQHRGEILEELLTVPEHIEGVTLEELRELAWRMRDYIDGPDKYDRRIHFLPEYERLVSAINLKMTQAEDRKA